MDFDFSAYKVLFCDEDPENIDIARQTYTQNGIGDFFGTPSPEGLIEQISERKPDLIILAMLFSDQNGIELVHKIRKMNEGEFYKTPILMMLDRASQNLLREVCRAGIEGALRKPLSPEKLIRFSRAVILKPRRFICVNHYFGPERRMRSDPHFEGSDRRKKPATILTGQSKLSGGPLEAMPADTSKEKPKEDFDWSKTSTPKRTEETLEIAQTETKKKPETLEVSETKDKAKASSEIEAKAVKEAPKKQEKEKAEPEKPKAEKETVEPVEETGPEDDDFEEVIDLEECLNLHKEWINSGGKRGQQANRPHSDFRGQEIAEADFTGAVLPQSTFEGVNCSNTVFRKADLKGSTFKEALLSSADLRVARLAQADLRNAKLDRANLMGADLSGANLEGASLMRINLSGANLNRVNLRGANLSTAQGLISDQIKRAITDSATRLPSNL